MSETLEQVARALQRAHSYRGQTTWEQACNQRLDVEYRRWAKAAIEGLGDLPALLRELAECIDPWNEAVDALVAKAEALADDLDGALK